MILIKVMFYLLAAIAIGSAIYVAAAKNLLRSIFMFFVTLFALAGLYVLALADFVAITQIVIYVGGILVLILFGFMLSGRASLNEALDKQNQLLNIGKLPAILLAFGFFVVMFVVLRQTDADKIDWVQTAVSTGNTIKSETVLVENIGINLMTRYLLPFEVMSVLLMMALVGAAHIARKEPQT